MALLLAAGKLYPEALLTLAVRFIIRHAELQEMLDKELIFTEGVKYLGLLNLI